ncbi:ABC transporter ATP-binding protein [Halorussus halophilus]|uniref:ABC transporter ATP-binding protein n=1 Tax=Halorussus halophilus TaxID=2650975 RepID=UPI001300EB7F|nr:ABC transporter ATP-binding protein [Halorussus halophilus]
MSEKILDVEGLHTQFNTGGEPVHAVNGLSFSVNDDEIVGIVGESGSGKSVTALSLARLEDPGEIAQGSIQFRGTEMTTADDRTIRRIRGDGMAMVFQDPMTTLNPVYKVSEQIVESLKVHESPESQRLLDYLKVPGFSKRREWREKQRRAVELMEQVGIPRPDQRVDAYPHEFSGGMRQRAMLAIALAREPDLLIADEPTTALDVTIQAQILDRIKQLNEELGMAVLLITHDLGVVAELCDRVIVMYGGEIMETGRTEQILHDPQHPYTRSLLDCMPQNTSRKEPLNVMEGEVPDMIGGITGCPFAQRCEYASNACREGAIETHGVAGDHEAKCCNLHEVPHATPTANTVEEEGE